MIRTLYCYALIFDNKYCYVGSTFSYDKRIRVHKRALMYSKHTNRYVQQAYDKYEMTVTLLSEVDCEISERGVHEQHCFEFMLTCYEMLNIVEPKYSIAPQLSNSEAYKAYKEKLGSEQYRLKCRERALALWSDESYRCMMIEALTASAQTEESRRKHSVITKQLWQNPEYRNKVSLGLRNCSEQRSLNLSISQKRSYANNPNRRKQCSELSKMLWADEQYRNNISAKMHLLMQDETRRKHLSDVMKQYMAVNYERHYAKYDNPEVKQRMSLGQKRRYTKESERLKSAERTRTAMSQEHVRLKHSRHTSLANHDAHVYGSAKVYRYRQPNNVCQPYHSFILATKGDYAGQAIIFIWDTREVVAIVDAASMPMNYVRAKDSHEPLRFTK